MSNSTWDDWEWTSGPRSLGPPTTITIIQVSNHIPVPCVVFDQADELQLRREQLRYVLTESQHQEEMAESGWCLGESQGCPEGWTKIWKHGKIYLVGSCFFLEGDSWCALLFQKNNHHSWVRFTPIGGGLVSQLVPKWTCRPGDPGSKGAGKGRGMAQCWLRWTFFGTQIVRQRKSTTLV